jgi:D-arabinose 5-phosphate isomerase GutQ
METSNLDYFIQTTKDELKAYLDEINQDKLIEATKVIVNAKKSNGRVHVTGIGKPSHVAEYIAALLSSTGTPTYFLDGTETIHGSAGQAQNGDVVIAISNSGETEELKKSIHTLKALGVKIIGVSGGAESWLKHNSDVFLFAGITNEGDTLNKPPRISILAEIIILQSLSILLQQEAGIDIDDYYTWHPGGSLGDSIAREMGDENEN